MLPFRLHIQPGDWVALERALAYLGRRVISQDLSENSSPTFVDLTLTTPSNIYDLEHNKFADLQGGDTDEKYHLTNDQHTDILIGKYVPEFFSLLVER